MTVLHSVDFFHQVKRPWRLNTSPQAAFPEHHHDFHEIVLWNTVRAFMYSTGGRIPSSGGTVCFVHRYDRHLYEHTDNLCLTNVLWRSPDAFQFWRGLDQLLQGRMVYRFSLAGESECVAAGAPVGRSDGARRNGMDAPAGESRNLFMQLLVLLLRRSSLMEARPITTAKLQQLMAWLEDHFAEGLLGGGSEQFSLSLRTSSA